MIEIIVALMALVGTLSGSFLGIITSSKLVNYRIEELEKKVEQFFAKLNELLERVLLLEQSDKLNIKRIDELVIDINEIKKEVYENDK